METMDERAEALGESVRGQINPGNRALDIGVFVSQGLRDKTLTLYEAYQLSGMKMEFERLAYVQPAWPDRVRITILVELLNLRLLAAVFDEKREEAHWLAYAKEAYDLNREKRPHYILDRYPECFQEPIPPEFLQTLQAVRAGRSKPFNKGPYHTELFPGDECNCEELLLQGKTLPPAHKTISGVMENLLVELALLLD